MSSNTDSLARLALDEGTERLVRGKLTEAIANAQSRGLSSREGVFDGLKIVMSDSKILDAIKKLIKKVTGASYGPHAVGVVLANWIRTKDVGGSFLPDDSSVFAQGVRALISTLPAVAVGAGDSLSDVLGDWLDRAQADANVTAKGDRKGVLDRLVYSNNPDLKGRIPVQSLDEDGKLAFHPDGTPVVWDSEWIAAQVAWDREHDEKTVEYGNAPKGGKRPTRTKAAVPMHWGYASSDPRALKALGASRADLEFIKSLMTSKGWAESLSEEVKDVLIAVSNTVSKMPWMERMIHRDLFEDLASRKIAPKDLEAILPRFLPFIQGRETGRFFCTRETVEDVAEAVRLFLGGDLTWQNRVLRSAVSGFNQIKEKWSWPVAVAWGIFLSMPLWAPFLVLLWFAKIGIDIFLVGIQTPSVGMGVLFEEQTANVAISMFKMLEGGLIVFAITWFLPLLDLPLNGIWRRATVRNRWWKGMGRRISTFALIFVGCMTTFVWLGLPIQHRMVVLGIILVPMGVGFGLVEANRGWIAEEVAAEKLLKILGVFGGVPLALVILSGMIETHTGTFMTGAAMLFMGIDIVLKMMSTGNQYLVIAAMFAVICGVLAFIQWKGTKIYKGKDDALVKTTPKLKGWAISAGILATLAMVLFVRYAPPTERAQISSLFNPTVLKTDIEVSDAATGSSRRETTKTKADGTVTSKVKERRVVGTKPAATRLSRTIPAKKKVDLCATNPPPDVARNLGC